VVVEVRAGRVCSQGGGLMGRRLSKVKVRIWGVLRICHRHEEEKSTDHECRVEEGGGRVARSPTVRPVVQ
jgi:hypothetical protein